MQSACIGPLNCQLMIFAEQNRRAKYFDESRENSDNKTKIYRISRPNNRILKELNF